MSDLNEQQTLAPCPFCGGTEAFVERLDYSAAYVQCDSDVGDGCSCQARGPIAVQDDDGEEIPGGAGAIAAWNRRAPAAAPAPVAAIKTWVERFIEQHPGKEAGDCDPYVGAALMEREIADLRAALAAAPAAAPIVQPDRMQFVHAIMCKLDEYGLAVRDDNADWRLRVRGEIFDSLAGSAPAADAAGQSEKEKLFDYLTALATEAGFPNISTAIAEARWSGRAASTPATDPCELSEAEFLSLRLGRVAKLVGVPMPSGTHEQIAGIAPVILGAIARHLEARTAAATSADAQPTPASSTADAKDAARLLNADELAALRRFAETCEDDEEYDVPKVMMRRLAAIGVIESKGFSRYQITDFGGFVLERAAIASSAGEVKP